MIKYGLKLWSNNTTWFEEAVSLYKKGAYDFIEIYSNSTIPHDYAALEKIRHLPVFGTHIGHLDKAGFHKFFLTDDQLEAWKMTTDIADFFDVKHIIVHPAITHTAETFWENLAKLNDERILVENMPVNSPFGDPDREFGAKLEDIGHIREKKEMCLDVEKAVKASIYHKVPYKEFLKKAVEIMKPGYAHISGGNITDPIDQHTDLWEAEFDVAWVRDLLQNQEQDIYLVFETPKNGQDLQNDLKNMEYFKNV